MKTGHQNFKSAAAIAVAAALCSVLALPASARPSGAQVAHGHVTFQRDGNRTIIRASDGSIINYLNFNIGPNEIVRFIQPGELSRVLNRINGNEPTLIQGTLLANGQVYIVNPAGVLFGGGSVVDVGGLFAAAGNLTDARFLNGVNKFTELSGPVVNDGSIVANSVNLMGRNVTNNGSIDANHGIITMLAGDQVLIRQQGEKITIKVDGVKLTDQAMPHSGATTPDMTATPGVENTGTINANRGAVVLGAGDMYSLAVRNSGQISAAKGDTTLASADGLIENTATGSIRADAVTGTAGSVTVQGPSVLNSGAISADSNSGHAGSVEVTSQDHTYLTDGSVISASGTAGNASGGTVHINSYDGLTVLAGQAKVDVSGGQTGGDGGFAEVSGKLLTFNGDADLRAKSGYQKGRLLLDPNNIIITDTGGDDSFLDGNIISFNEPNTAVNAYISDEALEALVGNITLQATGDITFAHQVDFIHNNNLTLEAYKNINFNESVYGAHNITAHADFDNNGYGSVFVSSPLDLSGSATFNGVTTFLNSNTLKTAGSQQYLSQVILCVDMTLTASDIHFHSTLNDFTAGDQFLAINGPNLSDGVAIFDGPVGACQKLEWLQVNGSSAINGGVVITKDFQEYLGPVTLGADTTLTSTDAGEIRFGGTLNGSRSLLVQTAGLTRFDGDAGLINKLDSVTTDAPGQTLISGDMKAGVIAFNDPVTLGDDVILNGSTSVEFAQTIAGANHDLVINSPQTGFHGDATDLDLLQTDAAGTTDFDADMTGNKLDFNDVVQLQSDSILTGHDFIDFDKTIDGAFKLTTNSDHLVRFGGDVGGQTALHSLTTNVGSPDDIDHNLVVIDGNLIRATGNIRFNPGGRSSPAHVATIAARDAGGVKIQSDHGDISMGPNEKLTSLGNLKLIAHEGMLILGDLNAFGNLLADSPDIRLRARQGGPILKSNGNYQDDNRASYVIYGSANFTSQPTVIGSGKKPVFAIRVLNHLHVLGDFLRVAFPALRKSDFTFGAVVLDLAAPSSSAPPPTTPPNVNLATALPGGPTQIKDRVKLDPFALRPMERLAIYVRTLRADELRGSVAGRAVYNDTPDQLDASAEDHTVVVNRLRRQAVLEALKRHTSMFVKDVPADQEGAIAQQDQTPFIREALAKAWKSYLDREAAEHPGGANGQIDPAGFRAFLENQNDQQEALAYLDGLRGLFNEIRIMGATKLEMKNSVHGVVNPITPEGVDQDQFEQALQVESIG